MDFRAPLRLRRCACRTSHVPLLEGSAAALGHPCIKKNILLVREQVKGDEEEIYKVVAVLEELCVNK